MLRASSEMTAEQTESRGFCLDVDLFRKVWMWRETDRINAFCKAAGKNLPKNAALSKQCDLKPFRTVKKGGRSGMDRQHVCSRCPSKRNIQFCSIQKRGFQMDQKLQTAFWKIYANFLRMRLFDVKKR